MLRTVTRMMLMVIDARFACGGCLVAGRVVLVGQINVRSRIFPLTWRHVMNGTRDIVFKRCGCTGQDTGRQLAGHCPRLAEPGHGSWYYAVQVTTVGGR